MMFIALLPFYQNFVPAPLLLLIGAVFVDNISRRIMPPAVLVLCTSTTMGVNIARNVKRRLSVEFFGGVRISLLLDARVSGFLALEYFYNVGIDNLHQKWGDDWTIAVLRLMRIVPVIVIDLRDDTEAMQIELGLIREHNLQEKTCFLVDPFRENVCDAFPPQNIATQLDELLDQVATNLGKV